MHADLRGQLRLRQLAPDPCPSQHLPHHHDYAKGKPLCVTLSRGFLAPADPHFPASPPVWPGGRSGNLGQRGGPNVRQAPPQPGKSAESVFLPPLRQLRHRGRMLRLDGGLEFISRYVGDTQGGHLLTFAEAGRFCTLTPTYASAVMTRLATLTWFYLSEQLPTPRIARAWMRSALMGRPSRPAPAAPSGSSTLPRPVAFLRASANLLTARQATPRLRPQPRSSRAAPMGG
jgi:hypothetical protein